MLLDPEGTDIIMFSISTMSYIQQAYIKFVSNVLCNAELKLGLSIEAIHMHWDMQCCFKLSWAYNKGFY